MVLPVEQFQVGPSWLKEALGQYSEIGRARLSQLLANKQSMENKRYPAIQDMMDNLNQLKANALNAQTQYMQSKIPQMNLQTQLLKYKLIHPELESNTPLGMAISLFSHPSIQNNNNTSNNSLQSSSGTPQSSSGTSPSINSAAQMNNQGSDNLAYSSIPSSPQAINNTPEPDNFKKLLSSMVLNNEQIPINDNMTPQQKLVVSYLNQQSMKNAQKQRLADLAEKKDILSIQQAKQNLFSTPSQRELVANVEIAKKVFNDNLLPSASNFLRSRSEMHPIDAFNSYKNVKQSMIQIIANMLKGSSGSRASSLIKLEDRINGLYPFSPESTWKSAINQIGNILNSESEIRSKSVEEQTKTAPIPVNKFKINGITETKTLGSKTYVKMNGKWYEQ